MSQIRLHSDSATVESLGTPQPERASEWRRYYRSSRALFTTFLALACEPRRCAPLIVDYWLLLQSLWSGKQLGPDVVYPLLGITKRPSGRLASLTLEHSRDESSYELRSTTTSPRGIDPPCVAWTDLDDVLPCMVQNGYSTQVSLYGLAYMLIFAQIILALVVHVLGTNDQGWISVWGFCVSCSLIFCFQAVLLGDGTLMLARRSDKSTSGCAVLLDQDFAVVLNGNQSVIEAIVESGFNLSDTNSGKHPPGAEHRCLPYHFLHALCDSACIIVLVLCSHLVAPISDIWLGTAGPVLFFASCLLFESTVPRPHRFRFAWVRMLPAACTHLQYLGVTGGSPFASTSSQWQFGAGLLSISLFWLLSALSNTRHYPIRAAKFLDVFGNPQISEWEFDTFAAAATFQCLLICRGIIRPIRTIDILAFLDLLVPDQRDIWKSWKARVAGYIVHEADIDFAPMIPTFGDERQQQLKELPDQAQIGYDTYRSSFD